MLLKSPQRLFTLIFSLALAVSTVSASVISPEVADKRKKVPTVEEVLATIAPDKLPKKASKDVVLRVKQPNVDFSVEASSTSFDMEHKDMRREGIDVSHYQGKIDWTRVAREGDIAYAYVKATEGADLVDDRHALNIAGARQAGVKVGSYHFYRPKAGVEAQLRNFFSAVQKHEQDLVPIVDIEDDRGVSEEKFIADLTEFIQRVTQHFGKKPLLYTGQNFYNKHFQGLFKDYQWMIAKYQEEIPVLLDGRNYLMWQYTAKGRVPGINGNVDRSCISLGGSLKRVQMK